MTKWVLLLAVLAAATAWPQCCWATATDDNLVLFGLNTTSCRIALTTFTLCNSTHNATTCMHRLCRIQSLHLDVLSCLRFAHAPQRSNMTQQQPHDPFPHAILFALHTAHCSAIQYSGRACYSADGCVTTAVAVQRAFPAAFLCIQSTDVRCSPPRRATADS